MPSTVIHLATDTGFVSLLTPSLPAESHIRLDDAPGPIKIRARLLHVETNRVQLIALRLRETVAGFGTRITPRTDNTKQVF